MKALIAMSGGVDSSTAALLIKNKGIETLGATMKLLAGRDEEIDTAKTVAQKMGIPFYVFDFSKEFKSLVIDRFIESYEEGKTPNPCIDCNKYLKFGRFYQEAKALSCDYVVTGHYARIEKQGKNFYLKKAKDENKDQSYVLYSLSQEILSETLLPLGDYTKEEIREIASGFGLINANKKDSQDICFVPNGDYVKVIKELSKKDYPQGDFVNTNGEVLGTHKGIIGYTVGQRKGLGLALPQPMYVLEKDVVNNKVILCSGEDLYKRELYVKDINWTLSEKMPEKLKCNVKLRYKQKEQPATVSLFEKGVKILFDEPQRAISKGQAAVFYDGDIVLGGGTITDKEELL